MVFTRLRIWGSGVRISSGAPALSTQLPCKKLPIFTVFARNRARANFAPKALGHPAVFGTREQGRCRGRSHRSTGDTYADTQHSRFSSKLRCYRQLDVSPGSADRGPSRTSKRRSSPLAWALIALHTRCNCRKTDRRPSACAPTWRCRNVGK